MVLLIQENPRPQELYLYDLFFLLIIILDLRRQDWISQAANSAQEKQG